MVKKIIVISVTVVLIAAVAITVPTVMHYSKKHRIEKLRSEAPAPMSEEEICYYLAARAAVDSAYAFVYNHRDSLPGSLLHAVCRNPETLTFATRFSDSVGLFADTLKAEDTAGIFPFFLQWDPRWGYAPYGDNVIGLSGCAPTCLSMVAVALTGDATFTPKYVADIASRDDCYLEGEGTKWSIFTEGCYSFGITGFDIKLKKRMIYKLLRDGTPIICSLYPGDFTSIGHFVVFHSIERDSIRLHDPNSRERSARLYSFKDLEWQIHHLWAFSKTDTTYQEL